MTAAQKQYLAEKVNEILEGIRSKGSVLVAMSGGVDSSLVALLSKKALGNKALAATADSATLPLGELEEARRLAREIGLEHIIINVDETSNPTFVSNPPERCYHCKKELILKMKEIAEDRGIGVIVDGTNADDMKVHRPGALALAEAGVYSPLADAGLGKEDVRKLARMLGLPNADRPSMACLASRLPYGEQITKDKLRLVAEAERLVKELTGARELRVRLHGRLARIEVGRDERRLLFSEGLMDRIAGNLKSLGLVYVTMDLLGYRSGSMDEALEEKIIPETVKGRRGCTLHCLRFGDA
ncbi:ATP-dependent sacrificial sulfur transferase LarE [Candidatus Bathyarchaeota archaeon]|nr:ATP-dependent sacrificial sulfur transferase LarE [Candidatus Bathyarchaeota archaeon]